MALSFEQFQQLRKKGLSNEQIINFESGFVPEKIEKPAEGKDSFWNKVVRIGGSVLSKGVGQTIIGEATRPENIQTTAEMTGVSPLARAAIRPAVNLATGLKGGTIQEQQARSVQTPFGEVKPSLAMTPKENIIEAAEVGSVVLGTSKTAAKLTEAVASPVIKFIAKKFGWTAKKVEKAAEYLAPRLVGKEAEEAYASGKIISPTTFTKEKFIPNTNDIQRVKVAQEAGIEMKGNYSKDIRQAKMANKKEAQTLLKDLKDNDYTFNTAEINSRLSQVERPVSIKSDEVLDKAYTQVQDKMLYFINKNPKTTSGAWQARIEFDKWIEKQFPNLYENDRWTPMRSAIKDIRMEVDNMINEKLNISLGEEADIFKKSMKKQSTFFDIIDTLSEKAVKGPTKLKPSVAGAIAKQYGKYAVGGATGAGVAGAILGKD